MTDSPVPSGSARPARALDIISVAFVALLLISNIAATKAFMVGSSSHYLIFDGGAILFPLTYIIGDVLSEVYGFARARRVIIMGFVASFLASLTFFVVQYLPPAPDYQNQDAFAAVLGVVWRAVLASLVGYLAGQLLTPTCSCGFGASGAPSTCGPASSVRRSSARPRTRSCFARSCSTAR